MELGPSNWGKFDKICEIGKRQTPIPLSIADAQLKNDFPALQFNRVADIPKYIKMENNGHTGEYCIDFFYE